MVCDAGDQQAVVSINELLIGFAPRLLLGHVGLQLPFDRFQRLARWPWGRLTCLQKGQRC